LEDGQTCYLVSNQWVQSVIGDGKSGKIPTIDPESIVPVDNSDIVWEVLDDPTIGVTTDPLAKKFVRLKPGMSSTEHFTVFPPSAWELLMQWPGLAPGQFPISRKAHASSNSATDSNIMFEFHPPVLTIHRLWSANSPRPVAQITKSKNPPPIRLARSSTTVYRAFLAQAKHLTDIDLKDKVRVWSIPRKLAAGGSSAQATGPTPPSSPEPSSEYINPQDSWTHMLLDVESFLKLEKGSDREEIELSDPTANVGYNGKRSLALLGITVDQAIVLDEHISGHQYVSNFSPGKHLDKPAAARSSSTSLTVSRNTRSGRTSPAPSAGGVLTRGRAQRSGRANGTVGLGNMGNTCYMNAALQCVRSVEELTRYFLSREWQKEINRDNVLAHNGDVASAYAHLLYEIYKDPSPTSVTPRQFKNTIGRYAPSFSGWGQQDSQEFLGFLLDGLQEDLSRVKKKPYIEKPDSTDDMINNPSAIRDMAEKVWDITKKRDDSVIADLFTGLYKSTLVCPDPACAKVSITFDPFNNLTLPLPVENKWGHTVRYFPLNEKPYNIRVELDKTSSIKKLKEFISARVHVPVERLHGAEEWKNKFYKQYANGAGAADEIATNDNAWFFELEDVPTNWNSAETKKGGQQHRVRSMIDEAESPSPDTFDKMLVPVIHRKPASSKTQYSTRRHEFACVPFFILLDPEEVSSVETLQIHRGRY
jgi:ubiquitin carboxyl-terminal hydrolase 4/11